MTPRLVACLHHTFPRLGVQAGAISRNVKELYKRECDVDFVREGTSKQHGQSRADDNGRSSRQGTGGRGRTRNVPTDLKVGPLSTLPPMPYFVKDKRSSPGRKQ
ncbi:hypothetical protein PoB_001584700 [Plakobranchus ocellatus]|uniref:Uncharacterized protein n=1 Tax=Plakobranchus ocellatus TaxID=259542 RepID=A0AAV3Z2B5_9GAST|nr:hypothetical protein PoB_001584700 [Plakobranchus ocellatus]